MNNTMKTFDNPEIFHMRNQWMLAYSEVDSDRILSFLGKYSDALTACTASCPIGVGDLRLAVKAVQTAKEIGTPESAAVQNQIEVWLHEWAPKVVMAQAQTFIATSAGVDAMLNRTLNEFERNGERQYFVSTQAELLKQVHDALEISDVYAAGFGLGAYTDVFAQAVGAWYAQAQVAGFSTQGLGLDRYGVGLEPIRDDASLSSMHAA